VTKRVPRAEFQAFLLKTLDPETAETAGTHVTCGGQLLLCGTEGSWKVICMRCGETTVEEEPPSEDPFVKLRERLRAAQQEYIAALSEEELEAHRTCQCKLCQFARSIDEFLIAADEVK
jgi:hypothetical protein